MGSSTTTSWWGRALSPRRETGWPSTLVRTDGGWEGDRVMGWGLLVACRLSEPAWGDRLDNCAVVSLAA